MKPPTHPKVTTTEELILETYYQSNHKMSFTSISNVIREEICGRLGRGWEFTSSEEGDLGINRLRAWWRKRSSRETKTNSAAIKSKELSKNQKKNQIILKRSTTLRTTTSKNILQERHNSISSSSPTHFSEDGTDDSVHLTENKPVQKRKYGKVANFPRKKKVATRIQTSSCSIVPIDSGVGEEETTPQRKLKLAQDLLLLGATTRIESASQDIIADEVESDSYRYYTEAELHSLQAKAINENSDIIFFQTNQLTIGNWNRTSNSNPLKRSQIGTWNRNLEVQPDLMAYFSPEKLAFVYWINYSGEYYRIILPIFTLSSLKIFQSTSTSKLILLFTLYPKESRCCHPSFKVSTPLNSGTNSNTNSNIWIQYESVDFTQERQASNCEIYILEVEGVDDLNKGLQAILISILRTSDSDGAETMKDFLQKIWWSDWKEEELTSDDLVKCMSFPLKEGIEGSSESLVYRNVRRGGKDLVLDSVYHHLRSSEYDAGNTGMEEIRESINGAINTLNIPPTSSPSLYYSRTSSYEYDFVESPTDDESRSQSQAHLNPHYSYPLNNPLETYSDSFEPPITNYGHYLDNQSTSTSPNTSTGSNSYDRYLSTSMGGYDHFETKEAYLLDSASDSDDTEVDTLLEKENLRL